MSTAVGVGVSPCFGQQLPTPNVVFGTDLRVWLEADRGISASLSTVPVAIASWNSLYTGLSVGAVSTEAYETTSNSRHIAFHDCGTQNGYICLPVATVRRVAGTRRYANFSWNTLSTVAAALDFQNGTATPINSSVTWDASSQSFRIAPIVPYGVTTSGACSVLFETSDNGVYDAHSFTGDPVNGFSITMSSQIVQTRIASWTDQAQGIVFSQGVPANQPQLCPWSSGQVVARNPQLTTSTAKRVFTADANASNWLNAAAAEWSLAYVFAVNSAANRATPYHANASVNVSNPSQAASGEWVQQRGGAQAVYSPALTNDDRVPTIHITSQAYSNPNTVSSMAKNSPTVGHSSTMAATAVTAGDTYLLSAATLASDIDLAAVVGVGRTLTANEVAYLHAYLSRWK